jgi:predicted HTH transcriptional regulator
MTDIARNSDPATSHQAAAEITADGSRDSMCETAYKLLKANPGSTAKELDKLAGANDGQIRKRLSDLAKAKLAVKGAARKCGVSGKSAQTWHPLDIAA